MQLDKLVKIERRAHTQDAAGQVRDTWQLVAEVWASIRPLAGSDYYSASGARAEVTHEIILRYGPSLLPKDRISYQGRHFEVLSPMNMSERNRYLRVRSKENVG